MLCRIFFVTVMDIGGPLEGCNSHSQVLKSCCHSVICLPQLPCKDLHLHTVCVWVCIYIYIHTRFCPKWTSQLANDSDCILFCDALSFLHTPILWSPIFPTCFSALGLFRFTMVMSLHECISCIQTLGVRGFQTLWVSHSFFRDLFGVPII